MNRQGFPSITKIRGLSDIRYMPRRGKIRLGIKVKNQNGKEYPKETDYFVCPEDVQEVFGDKPKQLQIMFPVNRIESVFPQSYKWYGGSVGVKCKGDGEIAWRKQDNGLIEQINCPCEKLDSGQCSLRGSLFFMLPKVSMGWCYSLDTGSFHSTVSINSGIDYVQDMVELATGVRRFALIPLILERVPQKTGGGGDDGTKAQQTHYIVKLYSMLNEEKMKEIKNNLANQHASQIALPEPEDINPEMDDSQPAIPVIDMGVTVDAEEPEYKTVDQTAQEIANDFKKANEPTTFSASEEFPEEPVVKKEPSNNHASTAQVPRKLTQKIKLNGKEVMTAGVKSLQIKSINTIQARDIEHKDYLKKYIKEIGIDGISGLTSEEAVAFINDPFNKEEEKETFTAEQAKHNSQFWAIVGEIGLDKDERDLLKKYFYKLYQVKSMHEFNDDLWLASIDFLKDSQDDADALKSLLFTMKDNL